MTLNGSLIRTLRQERQYSRSYAATLAGVSSLVMQRIEDDDPNADSLLTIRGMTNLADALGVPSNQLLGTQPTGQPEHDADSASDATLLSGLLLTLKKQAIRKEIAAALNWDNRRLNAAVTNLDETLTNTGIALHKPGDVLQLVPTQAAAVTDATDRLTITRRNHRGMDATAAKNLHKVYEGKLSGGGRKSPHTHTALRLLCTSGAIVNTNGDQYAISPDVAFALNET